MNPDGTPAHGVAVEMDTDEVHGVTAANGVARLSINTAKNPQPLTITVSAKNL